MDAAKGWTLVELLVSLVLLAILTALAVPGYDRLIKTQGADRLRDDLFADLTLARSQALSLGLPVAICTSADLFVAELAELRCQEPGRNWSAGWLVFVDLNEDKQHQSDERLLAIYEEAPGDVEVRFNRNQAVLFDRQGGAPGSGASFYLCRNDIDYAQRIVISRGRVRFAKADSGGCA